MIHPWSPPDTPPDPWGRNGRWDASFGIGGLTLANDHIDTLGYFSIGGGYRLTDCLSANLEFDVTPGKTDGFSFDEEGNSFDNFEIWAYGGMGTLRAEIARAWPVALYVDGGLGGLHTRRSLPSEGARDNWLKAAGVGILFRIGSNGYASVGARYVRVSSRLFEGRGSPAFNGAQYYMGFSFNW